jgi:hypothetical protein
MDEDLFMYINGLVGFAPLEDEDVAGEMKSFIY